jgi:hypothetical protein
VEPGTGAGKEETMEGLLFGVDISTSAAAGAVRCPAPPSMAQPLIRHGHDGDRAIGR